MTIPKHKDMTTTPEFKIYKEGTTSEKVTILSTPSIPFNKAWKIAKYVYLGYQVFDMNDNQIVN